MGFTLFSVAEIATWMAVILWAYGEGGAALAGVVAVVQLVPAAVLTPLLAGIGTGTSRGRALSVAYVGCTVACAGTTVFIALDGPAAGVALSSAVLTLALSFVRPAYFAALPQLVESPTQLVSANAIASMAEGLALFAGPLLAGVVAQLAGLTPVMALGTVALAGALLSSLGLGLDDAPGSGGGGPGGWRRSLDGMSILWSDAGAALLLLVMSTRFVLAGTIDVLGVSYAQDSLGLGESAAGILIGAAGIGAIVGGASSAVLLTRDRLSPLVLVGGLAQGIGFAAVAALTVVAPAALLLALTGAGGAVLMVAGRTLLQRTGNDDALAQVFAVQEAVGLLGAALGSAVVPALVDSVGTRGAFVPVGLVCAALVVLTVGRVRRLDDTARLFPEQVALLRQVPFLAPLPPYELERLAASAEWVLVSPGVDVVRQGDAGDRFFVVDTGSYSVVVDGVIRLHRLSSGDGFGEIALLRQVPRTATVTAHEPGRLLALSADDFMAAVTGSVVGADLAAEVTASHLLRDETDKGRAQRE